MCQAALPHSTHAHRRYISSAELESLSSYMRGRLTADRVNQSLDELAAHAARNAALVLAARRGRVAGADKRHGMWLAYSVAVMEGGGGPAGVAEGADRTLDEGMGMSAGRLAWGAATA